MVTIVLGVLCLGAFGIAANIAAHVLGRAPVAGRARHGSTAGRRRRKSRSGAPETTGVSAVRTVPAPRLCCWSAGGASDDAQQLRDRLFATYVRTMLTRRRSSQHSAQQTIRRLAFLAGRMRRHSETVFAPGMLDCPELPCIYCIGLWQFNYFRTRHQEEWLSARSRSHWSAGLIPLIVAE